MSNEKMHRKKRALIIVDHGSTFKEANDMLIEVAKMIRQSSKYEIDIVKYAHMELANPTISEAFDACVAEGAEEIIVHPYFLSPGRHSKEDIPNMVKEAARKHPHITYTITEPLGIHPKIIDVVLDRVVKADR
ncbi:MAG: CbiX/SirB N-terminal domain-containing protein [Thermodesulfobacteriota bacterium]